MENKLLHFISLKIIAFIVKENVYNKITCTHLFPQLVFAASVQDFARAEDLEAGARRGS